MANYKTCMCPIYFRFPMHGDRATLEPLMMGNAEHTVPLYLLDALLDQTQGAGFCLSDDLMPDAEPRGNSHIILLSGPSGIGKSTFALELCCRMAADGLRNSRHSCALYISAEENAGRLVKKTEDYGWSPIYVPDGSRKIVHHYDTPFDHAVPSNCVLIKDILNIQRPQQAPILFKDIATEWNEKLEAFQKAFCESAPLKILVLDSLNVLSPEAGSEKKGEVFDAIQKNICHPTKLKSNPDLVIIVLDASHPDEHSLYWEYVSDIVFRFSWDRSKDYALRTFEIAKMRDQKHVLGPQRMKIYGGFDKDHPPYRKDGGVHIFPSIHWYLSRLQSDSSEKIPCEDRPSEVLKLPEDVEGLNKQISKIEEFSGFPKPGCTAIEGNRGSMKSHLAYLFMLHQAARKERNCLLVSLRDDEKSVLTTLGQIVQHQGWKGVDVEKLYLQQDRIGIIYNEVGNVSPEELFQRIYVAIQRKRKNNRMAEVVIINELDELNNRFPLIAREVLFVPALIKLLLKNHICVVTASATGEESSLVSSEGLHGLNPMADLLLRFERVSQKKLPERFDKYDQDVPESIRKSEQITRVEAVRVPAGQVGGQIGFMYRDIKSQMVKYIHAG